MIATVSWPFDAAKFWDAVGPDNLIKLTFAPEVAWNSDPALSIGVQGIATPHGLLRAADGRTQNALGSIPGIEGGLLDSSLPDCQGEGLSGKFIRFFALAFSPIEGMQGLGGAIDKAGLGTDAIEALCVSALSPFSEDDRARYGLDFTARFPLLNSSGQAFSLRLSHGAPATTNPPDGSRVLMYFEIVETSSLSSANLVGRVSGMEFVGRKDTLIAINESVPSYLAISVPADEKTAEPQLDTRLKVEWEWQFAIGRFTPLRGDILWGERDERTLPLLVGPATRPDITQQEPPYVLRAHESISPRDDRHFVCEIRENSLDQDGSLDRYTLLSRNPWSVLRFTRIPFSQSGDESNATIATYDSDDCAVGSSSSCRQNIISSSRPRESAKARINRAIWNCTT